MYGIFNTKNKSFISVPDNIKLKLSSKKHYQIDKIYVRVANNNINLYIGNVGDLDSEYKFIKLLLTDKWNKVPKYIYNEPEYTQNMFNQNIYSIDAQGCQDIDDAISIYKSNDITYIGIHIADVSYYMNDNLHKSISGHVSSLYLDEQINMLGDYNTNICSLKENIPKRCVSLYLLYKDDKIADHILKREVIKVSKNLSYEDANTYNGLKELYDFTNTINSKDLVEKIMILANKYVGTLLSKKVSKGIYRKQDINSQAIYVHDKDNSHHNTLNTSMYTHFTSPIRRYTDILVHELLLNDSFVFDVDILNDINTTNKMYKIFSNRYKMLNIMYKLNKDYIKTQATIVSIQDDVIEIYIDDIDIYVWKKNITKHVFMLNQKIDINLVFMRHKYNKIQINITKPNISNYLLDIQDE